MSALTITSQDGTTGELLAHVAELQRKASAFDTLQLELKLLADHIEALAHSYNREAAAFRAQEGRTEWWSVGKAQSYFVAASKIREIL